MKWIQATPRPCHHRFPIRLVRRPPPSGTPPSLEQISQPQTTLMNWRCSQAAGDFLAFWPLYRVAKFDDFFSLRPKLDVPAELTGILVGSGRLIRKRPLIHHDVGGFGDRELIVHQELDRIGAKILHGDLVRPILDRSLVQNPGFRGDSGTASERLARRASAS